MENYKLSSKLLHYLALNFDFVKKTSFDIDCFLNNKKKRKQKPLYISGLARAGTTILLEILYKSKEFTSLTYENMPFVLSPILWNKLSKQSSKSKSIERMHNDKMLINCKSPEAFEEVFWKTFSPDYIENNKLIQKPISENTIENYKKYINNIIFSKKENSEHYLAKNNNNLLRIKYLKKAFPECSILIVFRDPVNHIRSYKKQFERFLKIQQENKFSKKYMEWLGHFEFGLIHKPLIMSEKFQNQKNKNLDYFIDYWKQVYESLIIKHKNEVFFLDYDLLCENPQKTLTILAEKINLDPSSLLSHSSNIEKRVKKRGSRDEYIRNKTSNIYKNLKELSIK